MRPLSNDLRERIVAAVHAGKHSLRQLAKLFCVDLSTIVRLLQLFRSTGSVQPKPHAGGPPSSMATRKLAYSSWCKNTLTQPSWSCGIGWALPAASWRSFEP